MNQKLKSENYDQLGGINQKLSQYQTSPFEFLDIKNFDFQTPGALTSRWGSTQYVSQTFGAPISSIYEFTKLNGSSYVVIGHTGGIWYGATTGNSQGMSFGIMGQTQVINFGFWVQAWSWSANLAGGPRAVPVAAYYKGISSIKLGEYDRFSGGEGITASITMVINPQIIGKNDLSQATTVDNLFSADGNKYFRFDGATIYPNGLPFPTAAYLLNDYSGYNGSSFNTNATLGLNLHVGGSFAIGPSPTQIITLPTGSYVFYASYVNNRGFQSQIWPIFGWDLSQYNNGSTAGTTFSTGVNAVSAPFVGINTPLSYGISTINIYYYFSPTTLIYSGTTTNSSAWSGATNGFLGVWNFNYSLLGSYPASGSTITELRLGTTTGGYLDLTNNIGAQPNLDSNDRTPLGATFVTPQNGGSVTETAIGSFFPRFIEVYKERVFAGGFSAAPSTSFFTDVGEPEGYRPTSSFEIRTNDGDYLTAIKAFSTRLYYFKKNSIYALYGDTPQNFYLQEITTSYGCLNHKCVVVFDDTMLFLDAKGVMLYTGAAISCLSTKIQPIFDRMNYSAALEQACMTHDKLRNQVLIGIPVDGSNTNNLTVVYDYVAQAWTTQEGFNPSIFATVRGRNNLKHAFYGSYSGTVNWFGPSFFSDNGVGFTTYFKTRFLHDMGESIEKQWRRLYINADAPGATLNMPVNFFKDYGTSRVLSTTFKLGQFQNRMEFGIPAKSLAFELYNMSANSPLRIYGYTIESRLQRRV